jgi:lactoylglutathione lyase
VAKRRFFLAASLKALITIYSEDIARAVDFYSRVPGLVEIYRFPCAGDAEHVEFRVGSATIAVSSAAGLRSRGLPPATPGHPFEIGLKIEDVDAGVKELHSAGVNNVEEAYDSPAGNRYAYFADPDGNWISLYQNLSK